MNEVPPRYRYRTKVRERTMTPTELYRCIQYVPHKSTCDDKIRYAHRQDAESALTEHLRRYVCYGISAYPCALHRCWHLWSAQQTQIGRSQHGGGYRVVRVPFAVRIRSIAPGRSSTVAEAQKSSMIEILRDDQLELDERKSGLDRIDTIVTEKRRASWS